MTVNMAWARAIHGLDENALRSFPVIQFIRSWVSAHFTLAMNRTPECVASHVQVAEIECKNIYFTALAGETELEAYWSVTTCFNRIFSSRCQYCPEQTTIQWSPARYKQEVQRVLNMNDRLTHLHRQGHLIQMHWLPSYEKEGIGNGGCADSSWSQYAGGELSDHIQSTHYKPHTFHL
jgi:hypothetical protein